jgi:hypothetical protein
MSAYPNPGYKNYVAGGIAGQLQNGASAYKPNNYFKSGGMAYGPGEAGHLEIVLTFGGVPVDLSNLEIKDGLPQDPATPTTTFTYTYGGAPGAGIIPLVGGGGTAAQAAAATQLALSAQLDNWDVTIDPGTPLVVLLTYKHLGANIETPIEENGDTNIVFANLGVQTFGQLFPGRVGRMYCSLPGM